MKTTILLIAILFTLLCSTTMAQDKKADTVYILHEKDILRLYTLLNVGMNAVLTSDDFSKNGRKDYQREITKIDSAIRPQFDKWHSLKAKPKTP